MAQHKAKTEAEKSIPEMVDEVTREEMRQMYKDDTSEPPSRRRALRYVGQDGGLDDSPSVLRAMEDKVMMKRGVS